MRHEARQTFIRPIRLYFFFSIGANHSCVYPLYDSKSEKTRDRSLPLNRSLFTDNTLLSASHRFRAANVFIFWIRWCRIAHRVSLYRSLSTVAVLTYVRTTPLTISTNLLFTEVSAQYKLLRFDAIENLNTNLELFLTIPIELRFNVDGNYCYTNNE